MIQLTLKKEDVSKTMAMLDKIPPNKRNKVAYNAMMDASAFVLRVLKWNVSGIILNVRTGNLRNSLGMRVEESDNNIEGIVGSGQGEKYARVKYADILETGGTIVPRLAKWLTIPLKAALTPSGVARGKARDFPNTYFSWRGGKLFLIQKTGKRSERLLFILKKSVKIPAFRYMERTAISSQEQVPKIIVNRIAKELEE